MRAATPELELERRRKIGEKNRAYWVARRASKNGSVKSPRRPRGEPRKEVALLRGEPRKEVARSVKSRGEVSILDLVSGANRELAGVSGLSLGEIEAALAQPLECERLHLALRQMIEHGEKLMSVVAHCLRANGTRLAVAGAFAK